MTKVTLNTFSSISNPVSFLAGLNENFSTLITQIDFLLSRDGESPNTMTSPLDMNSQRILNLPEPTHDNDPIRLQDATDLTAAPGLVWRGAYDNGDDYEVNDAVSYQGSSYIAIDDTTGNLPTDTDFWEVLASKGDTGAATVGDALAAIDADTASANTFYVWSAADAGAFQSITAAGLALLDDAADSNQRTTLGLGDSAVLDVGTAASTVAAGDDSRFTAFTINDQSGATYTFATTDPGKMVRQTAGGTHTYTVNPFATTAIPVGSVIRVRNTVGSGVLTLARGAGVTFYINGGTTSADASLANGAVCDLVHEATNVWLVLGAGVS